MPPENQTVEVELTEGEAAAIPPILLDPAVDEDVATEREARDIATEPALDKSPDNPNEEPHPDEDAPETAFDPSEPEPAVTLAPDPAPPKPSVDLEPDRLFRKKIQDAESDVAAAEREMIDAAEVHKSAKKAFEAQVDRLRRIIRDQSPGVAPLLDKIESVSASAPVADAAPDEPKPVEDESWKLVPLSSLGLPEKLVEKITDFRCSLWPISTLGHLAEFTSQPNRRLTDIPGVGPTAAEKIDDALAAFWSSRKAPTDREKDTADVDEMIERADVPGGWQEIKLSAVLASALHGRGFAEALAERGFATLGQIQSHLAAGKSIEDIPGFIDEDYDILATEVDAACTRIGGPLRAAITRTMLGFDEPAAAPDPKPKKGKKASRASQDATPEAAA